MIHHSSLICPVFGDAAELSEQDERAGGRGDLDRVLSILGHDCCRAVGDGAFVAPVRGGDIRHRLIAEDGGAGRVLEREGDRGVVYVCAAAGVRQSVQADNVIRADADDFDHGLPTADECGGCGQSFEFLGFPRQTLEESEGIRLGGIGEAFQNACVVLGTKSLQDSYDGRLIRQDE